MDVRLNQRTNKGTDMNHWAYAAALCIALGIFFTLMLGIAFDID